MPQTEQFTCSCIERFTLRLLCGDPDQQEIPDSALDAVINFLGAQRLERGVSFWIGRLMILTGWKAADCVKALAGAGLNPAVLEMPLDERKWQEAIDAAIAPALERWKIHAEKFSRGRQEDQSQGNSADDCSLLHRRYLRLFPPMDLQRGSRLGAIKKDPDYYDPIEAYHSSPFLAMERR